MRTHALLLVYKILPKVSLLPQLMSLINPLHLVARHGILSNYGDVWLPYQHVKLFMSHSECWYLSYTSLFTVAGVVSYPHMQNLDWRDQFTGSLWTKGDKNSPRGSCRFHSTLEQEASSLSCPYMF